ncbi:porin [Extensimonas vulgaris]|uniref:Putative porin n=1 Tax=Extensimonas vulgaris TaxID=1031594 RepID=A0A369AQB1_9BURK|nr:porin [Extensimonas vulgaris]RCX11572.1 putative porin [Extensimonas vulgaris]TWI40467.1 putative porin [Extensimonas vulgaris]TXD16488.1 porin [Extensimonas vulgaris]
MKHTQKFQRSALMAAVLAASAVGAQAQSAASNVRMYGVLDVGVSTFSRSATVDKRLTKMNTDTNSSSIWGITGSEDLGGGLAAQFGLEAGLDPKSGGATGGAATGAQTPIANVLWRRGSWVGLKSNSWGSLRLGRDYTTHILAQLVNGTGMPDVAINSSTANLMVAQGIGNDFWNSNMIRYTSPSFAGFDVGVQYILGEQPGDSSAGRGIGGVVNYTYAPFKVALSYTKNNGVNDPTLGALGNHANDDVHYWILTGSYDVGKYRLAFLYDKVSNKNKIPYGWLDSKAWLIGGNYAFTPELRVGLQYSEINASDDAVAGTPYKKKSKYAVITAHYSLSKRTYLFSTFGHADNGIAPIQPLWGGSQGGQQAVKGDSINGFVVGMVHRF